ncbi:MAG: chorismate-binding protein [SAR324 cluster bacterium]|nr:chorismate-binding protein [SAR324 cluster bacterium]
MDHLYQHTTFNFDAPFAIIKKNIEETALILEGKALALDRLSDIPRKQGIDSKGEVFDTISLLPFCQLKERQFRVHDADEKILCIEIQNQTRIELEDLIHILPTEKVSLKKGVTYNYSFEEYEQIIRAIVEEEIGNGEGANFVIPRKGEAKITEMHLAKALALYKNLLQNEMGSYWKFIFYNGDRFFIGATPERHISVHKKRVKMNPISGTFRKKGFKVRRLEFKDDLLKFLTDQKEINELFMVVDEELKMMARFCEEGGMIVGPLLKEMSKLIHTEYLLAGKSSHDIIKLLRDSMYAATVTGSPVENACNIIHKYENESRSYYASALALIGRDQDGEDTLDSPITIRTVEINKEGALSLRVGATLVRDSIPSEEVQETVAKIGGMLENIENPPSDPPQAILPYFAGDDEIHMVLQQRNQYLSKFWFFNQEDSSDLKVFSDFKITIIDNEDDFCLMMQHMINRMGAVTQVIRYSEYKLEKDTADLVIVGPGPGNPNDLDHPKMKKLFEITEQMLVSNRKFLAICLGHQVLCKALKIEVIKKEHPFQGVQKKIDLFGKNQRVGFYNTFAGKWTQEISGVNISFDPESREIHALNSNQFASFQFHAESILTQNGYDLLKQALENLKTS